MATVPITVFDDVLLEASNFTIPAGQSIALLDSVEFDNSTGTIYNSLKVEINYSDLLPVSGGQYFIGATIEAKDDLGNFSPIHYQFTPIRGTSQALKRIMILQPDMDTFNLGIDDIVFPVDDEEARISREQGLLPESTFKVCLKLQDNDPLGANPWTQVRIGATGEKYNV